MRTFLLVDLGLTLVAAIAWLEIRALRRRRATPTSD